LLTCRQQFNGGDQFHASHIDVLVYMSRACLPASAIPPRHECRGFSRRFR
jgi:hypothetical protein